MYTTHPQCGSSDFSTHCVRAEPKQVEAVVVNIQLCTPRFAQFEWVLQSYHLQNTQQNTIRLFCWTIAEGGAFA